MPRMIKLLPGNRASTQDVFTDTEDDFTVDCGADEIVKVTIDCTRWIEGATVTAATSSASFAALVLATPLVTATITGNDGEQETDITITTSDGQKRKITLRTRGEPRVADYGWAA